MAMCMTYDEDLSANHFFQSLRNDFPDIFYKAILEGCVVCVPRAGCFQSYVSIDDALGHILLPNQELPESHFSTLSGKEVKICKKEIIVSWDASCEISIQILFEETYYTEDFFKYKVVCLEHPLEPKTDRDGIFTISTLRDCIDFINGMGSHKITEALDYEISEFVKNSDALENASLQTLKELTYDLYTKCFQEALFDKRMREKTSNPHNKKNLRLAVETYVLHGLYKPLFKYISTCTAEQDGHLNKIIRNCMDLHLKDLEIRAEFHHLIPKAKIEIGRINGYGTVIGKLSCLRKMIAGLSTDPESGGALAADDLLPLIILILLKVNIVNWHAQLSYLTHFRFSSQGFGQDEDDFLVTTLEAALEHIDSGAFLPPHCSDSLAKSISWKSATNKDLLFQYAAQGDVENLKRVMSESWCNTLAMCHPLCTCDHCQNAVEDDGPSVNSQDESGMTPLHIAAKFGQPASVEFLISQNTDIDCLDHSGKTPLHHAALGGHQSCLLFLIQCGADVNASDNTLNTPLHFASSNGHLSCVKAMVYNCEHEGTNLLINGQNSEGETPLHIACRYGFLSIIHLLVTNGADPSIVNKRKLSAFQLANNLEVTKLLKLSRPKFKCYLNVKAINFDFLDDSFHNGRIVGEMPLSSVMAKKVDKMLRAVSHDDVNLACFYMGLNPMILPKRCHPLCGCSFCKKTTLNANAEDKVDINMCDSEGNTALHIAVRQGLFEFSQLLLTNGAMVDVQNRKLLTPLIIACQMQRTRIVAMLLEAGSNVNLQDAKGNTALHYVCSSCHSNRRLLDILLQYAPKANIKNKTGRTAVQEAESRMSIGVVNILKDAESK